MVFDKIFFFNSIIYIFVSLSLAKLYVIYYMNFKFI